MITVLDSTLREGEQTPGVYIPEHVKMEIARLLDGINIGIIEAGHPVVSAEIHSAVKHIAAGGFHARIAAHSRSVKSDVDCALDCGVGFLGIFYCVSDERLESVFRTDLSAAVDKISSVIAYAKSRNPELMIRFTPEDTVRSAFGNVVEAAVQAARAGADVISVADTTGFMIPRTEHNMYDYVHALRDALDKRGVHPKIAVHCHNDRGLALANAIDGYCAGTEIIDASVMGLGERAGIVDLASLLAALSQNFGQNNDWNLERLKPLYETVSCYSGIPLPVNFPVTGNNAFTHCAGVHTHAAQINPLHYQSLDPAPFGRKMKVALDHMSGISSVRSALDNIGKENVDGETEMKILEQVKAIGQTGRTVSLEELSLIANWVENTNRKEESCHCS